MLLMNLFFPSLEDRDNRIGVVLNDHESTSPKKADIKPGDVEKPLG